jgi:hypothetical protein
MEIPMKRMRAVPTLAMAVVACFVICGAGCDSGVDPSGRVAVSGVVTLDGRPASSGRVTFIPDESSENPAAAGPLDESGHFRIPSFAGPMPGAYTVRFTLNPIAAGDKFDRRDPSANQTFEEIATIAAGSPAELNFQLTSPPARTTRRR